MPRPLPDEPSMEELRYRRRKGFPLGSRQLAGRHRAILADAIEEVCEELGLDPLTAPRGKWIHIALALPENFRVGDGADRKYYAWEIYFFYHERRGYGHKNYKPATHPYQTPDRRDGRYVADLAKKDWETEIAQQTPPATEVADSDFDDNNAYSVEFLNSLASMGMTLEEAQAIEKEAIAEYYEQRR